jgi:Na+/H+-dicarboxylate symporter
LSEAAEPGARKGGGFRVYGALIALVAGIVLGSMGGKVAPGLHEQLVAIAAFVGGLWLNALKMTVIPLVVALLIVGIAQGREAASAGRIAGRSVIWIVVLCTASAVFGAIAILLLTSAFPLPRETAAGLQSALAEAGTTPTGPLPGIGEFFKGIVPDNVISAAANGDVLPLVIFSVLFALALSHISGEGRRSLLTFFQAIADALLVIIGWVLWLAPVGVFALAYTVGSAAGASAFAGLGHYVVLISLIGVLLTLAAYPLGIIAGRVPAALFSRSLLGPQAVAISTRSSLASLPAMLTSAREIDVREQVADVTLPIAVALFRGTGPAMNVAVAFYVAHWLGIEPTMGQMIAATAVGAVMSYGAVSLPGEVSFISSIAPIAMALGVPIAPLALLVAVEMVPDIFRTVGNVSLDVALTAAVDRATKDASAT